MNPEQQKITLDYYKKCGYDEKAQQHFIERIGYRKTLVTDLKNNFQELKDQQTPRLSDGIWKIILLEM